KPRDVSPRYRSRVHTAALEIPPRFRLVKLVRRDIGHERSDGFDERCVELAPLLLELVEKVLPERDLFSAPRNNAPVLVHLAADLPLHAFELQDDGAP